MTDNKVIKELRYAAEWFTEHGRNTNTAIVGICERAIDHINRQKAEIERKNKENDRLSQVVLYHDGEIADAIEDFKDRLLEKAISTRNYFEIKSIVTTVVKEMVGDAG